MKNPLNAFTLIALACAAIFSTSAHAELDPAVKAMADKNPPYWQYQYDKTEINGEFTIDSDKEVQSESDAPIIAKKTAKSIKLSNTKPKAIEVLADPVVPQSAEVAPLTYDTSSDLLQDAPQRATITPAAIKRASFNWALSESNAEEMVGDDGSVQYAYAASRPIVACAPLHLCVIKLQPDESITNTSIGDSVRWKAQATTAGKYPVVIVKPTVVNIKTNLVIMTDAGRTYYITLVSYPNKWVPLISFYDPQKLVETITQKTQEQTKNASDLAKKKEDSTVATLPGDDVTAMDFDYVVTGPSSDIKPLRIFSSAGHTYIQMPDALRYKDAPAIFSLVNGEQQLVNYKAKGAYYIVDGVPDRINLILGNGGNAKTVTIQHKQKQ